MSKWSIPLEKLAETVKLDLETVARKVTLDLFNAVILRSPVGNPDTWKANSHRVFARNHSNALATLSNQRLLDDPRSYSRTGKVKVKLQRIRSARSLARAFPNVAGKGYVGGRFRANWVASFGAPSKLTADTTDRGRSEREALKGAAFELGGRVYFCNSLPYAIRLENGWSKQAPAGMVKLALAEADRKIKDAIRK